MKFESQFIYNLFIPLNTDTLSSYLTPILAQYNIQYNDFLVYFLNEYKKFLNENLEYILLPEDEIEDSIFSNYNLKVRVQLILKNFSFFTTPQYDLIFKPLILNHILLEYFDSGYSQRKLELLNILKLGSFYWWLNNSRVFFFNKKNFNFLKLYLLVKEYSLKKFSFFFKLSKRAFTNIIFFKNTFMDNKNNWIFYQKFLIHKNYIYCKDIILIKDVFKIILFSYNNNLNDLSFLKLKQFIIKKIRLKTKFYFLLLTSCFSKLKQFITKITHYFIEIISYKQIVYNWTFFCNNFLKVELLDLTKVIFNILFLFKLNIWKNLNLSIYAYYKFISK